MYMIKHDFKHLARLFRALWRGYSVDFCMISSAGDVCEHFALDITGVGLQIRRYKFTSQGMLRTVQIWTFARFWSFVRRRCAAGEKLYPGAPDDMPAAIQAQCHIF